VAVLTAIALAAGLVVAGPGAASGSAAQVTAMRGAPAGAWIRLGLSGAIWLVMVAIMIRVIGSWMGLGRHAGWMRPVFFLTDWIITPIARRLPPLGMLDLSPFVAYVVLLVLRSLVDGVQV